MIELNNDTLEKLSDEPIIFSESVPDKDLWLLDVLKPADLESVISSHS